MNKVVKRILVTIVAVLLLVIAWYVSPDQRFERRCKLNAEPFETALRDGHYEQAVQEYMRLEMLGIFYANRIRHDSPYAPKITGKENTACAYIETFSKADERISRFCFGMFAPNGIDNWYLEAVAPDGRREKIADDRKAGGFTAYRGKTSANGKSTGLDVWRSSAGNKVTVPGKYKLVLHVFEYDGEEITAEAEMVVVEKPDDV